MDAVQERMGDALVYLSEYLPNAQTTTKALWALACAADLHDVPVQVLAAAWVLAGEQTGDGGDRWDDLCRTVSALTPPEGK
jgi:hypothetical protein